VNSIAIDGWEAMEPADAANAVQKGADARHLRRVLGRGHRVVKSLTETSRRHGARRAVA
jgi:hypothetical protein